MDGRSKTLWIALTASVLFAGFSNDPADARRRNRSQPNCADTNCQQPSGGGQFNGKGAFTGSVPDSYFDQYFAQAGSPGQLQLAAMQSTARLDPDAALDRAMLRAIKAKRDAAAAEALLHEAVLERQRQAELGLLEAEHALAIEQKRVNDQAADVEQIRRAMRPPPAAKPETTLIIPNQEN